MFRRLTLVLGLVLGLAIWLCPQGNHVQVKIGPTLEIGHSDLLFGSIPSVCEDDQGNFYVLDRMECRVYKFSSDGRLLLKFGQKGQGPGDFQSPSRIVFTSEGELAILEDLFYVSFHRTDGSFIRRVNLNDRLGLGYIGPDRFYGWIWRPEDKQQVMVDGKNTVLTTFHSQLRDAFSVVLPDETGRMIMFNYDSEFYVPEFLFDYGRSLSAIGISASYELTLLDENGKTITIIKRDEAPQKITRKERAYLEQDILEFTKTKGWPPRVGRELMKKIPDAKNAIRAVRISPGHIFVFRFGPDITRQDAPVPVDVFTRQGVLLGTTELAEIPLFISEKAMYFVRNDESGNVFLARAEYSLLADS
jgi:hypothetical protein